MPLFTFLLLFNFESTIVVFKWAIPLEIKRMRLFCTSCYNKLITGVRNCLLKLLTCQFYSAVDCMYSHYNKSFSDKEDIMNHIQTLSFWFGHRVGHDITRELPLLGLEFGLPTMHIFSSLNIIKCKDKSLCCNMSHDHLFSRMYKIE